MTGAERGSESLEVHVLSHTHWDREWYHPAGRFRQRLVRLIDELLDDPLNGRLPFLLDGQAVVLDDYLAVRPERAADLASALRDGSLEAGPWYVLADELLSSEESLVRNLLAGRRALASFGAAPPPVLYSPDAFGHAAALPSLARGFGCDLVIAWRGYGGARWPGGDTVRWRSPSGENVLLYHLPPSGYELGANLPGERDAAIDRWSKLSAVLVPRSTTGVLLVQNGADHHARQRSLDSALAALADAASPHPVVRSTLRHFAASLGARAKSLPLPQVSGELRDSYGYTWTLQGTFGTRAAQKRRTALADRLLVRDADPWAALARYTGGQSFGALLRAAWRTLLLCHPHDTLCGCSTDEVARAMDARLEDVVTQGGGVRDDALHALIGHDAVAAHEQRYDWRSLVVVRNRAPRPRGGIAELEIESLIADVAVGPGSAPSETMPRRAVNRVRLDEGHVPVQVIDRAEHYSRTESPRHYPDNDLVALRRVVAWLPPVAAHGVALLSLDSARGSAAKPPTSVHVDGRSMRNDRIALAISDDGRVSLSSAGVTIDDLHGFDDVGDLGDLYTHSPVGPFASRARYRGARVVHRGPLRAAIETRWQIAVPLDRRRGGETPSSARTRRLAIVVRYELDAGASFLRVTVRGTNTAHDHRLRIVFHTGIVGGEVWADAPFGPVRRVPIVVPPEEAAIEVPPPTAPLERYVSIHDERRGATVFSDGLAEYEATDAGDIAVTLFRAVGELSRNDIPERPGHAGWPVPTPAAQSLGDFEASFAVMLHGARDEATAAAVEAAAEDVLLPLVGTTLRSAVGILEQGKGVALEGEGLRLGALKESDDERWIVARCVNVLDRPVFGRWRFHRPPIEAFLSRLDESPLERIALEDGAVPVVVAPRGIHTVLVR